MSRSLKIIKKKRLIKDWKEKTPNPWKNKKKIEFKEKLTIRLKVFKWKMRNWEVRWRRLTSWELLLMQIRMLIMRRLKVWRSRYRIWKGRNRSYYTKFNSKINPSSNTETRSTTCTASVQPWKETSSTNRDTENNSRNRISNSWRIMKKWSR